MHEVAEPDCQAIDQQADLGCTLLPNGSREIKRGFYRAPVSPALATVRLDPAYHLGIDTLGGGDIDSLAMTARQTLSESTLARTRTAKYQGYTKARFGRAHIAVRYCFGVPPGYRIWDDGKRGVGYILDKGHSFCRWDKIMRAPGRCQ